MNITPNTHTPGPWSIGEINDYWTDSISIVEPDGAAIACTTRGGGFAYEAPDALAGERAPALPNARLIAAAPELLDACKAALNDRMFKDWPEIATLLMAAIAKAEGTP